LSQGPKATPSPSDREAFTVITRRPWSYAFVVKFAPSGSVVVRSFPTGSAVGVRRD